MNDDSTKDLFVTTRWSLVLSAGRQSSPDSERALAELCRSYWFPLYAYVRKRTQRKEDAEDLVQAFFESFLKKNHLGELNKEEGKFRAFLLASLKHFLSNEWNKKRRIKRGGNQVLFSPDWQAADARYATDQCDHWGPDKLFDREWALSLLERVLDRLREEYVKEAKGLFFDTLKPFLAMQSEALSYSEIATSLNMDEGAVRVAVHRMRKKYRNLLQDEIAQTLKEPSQVEEELRSLREALKH